MQLKILINLDNAAFAPETQSEEIDLMLQKITRKIYHRGGIESGWSMRLLDSNGNCVGEATVCD